MNLWGIGAKVQDVDQDIGFLEQVGARLVIDDVVPLDGNNYRAPLLRWAGTYFHVVDTLAYERSLGSMPYGLAHVVIRVDDLRQERGRAIAAGAQELRQPATVTAGFGTRDVAFFRSPGGIVFEFIQIIERLVPDH